ncbi:hypothetical protein ACFUJY_30380 [Streptomyces sp. NPDC057249]|uniref:hypothetical protein n=1 Tax=Streptomyces sp. NPDC057249 TaxID=3346067 RepID=UPI0036410DFE
MTELVVAAILPYGPASGGLTWSLLEWVAALHDARRSGEALGVFEALVSMEAAEAADGRGSIACHFYSLIGYAQMLDAYGRGERAALVRQEALALLTAWADTGERKSWSSYEASFWAVLLSFSGADGERPASDGPRPPSGTAPMEWSPDAMRGYLDSRHVLRDEVDALAVRAAEDPDRYLAELVRLHRVLTVRSAVYWEHRAHLFPEQARSLFDEGVGLARQLSQRDPAEGTRTLARPLIDQSTFYVAACAFGPALDDFREVVGYLGEVG